MKQTMSGRLQTHSGSHHGRPSEAHASASPPRRSRRLQGGAGMPATAVTPASNCGEQRLPHALRILQPGGGGGRLRDFMGDTGRQARNKLYETPLGAAPRERRRTERISPSFNHVADGGYMLARGASADEELPTVHEGQQELTGYRLVDLQQLPVLMGATVCRQCAMGCQQANPMHITTETRMGLACCWTFKCQEGHEVKVWSSKDAAVEGVCSRDAQ